MEADQVRTPVRGTPQGGVLSPVLANVALHPLDKYWEQQHPDTKLVHYADDVVVSSRWRPAEAYMPSFERMVARLKLQLPAEKIRVVEAEAGFDFLGVHFVRKPTRRLGRKVFCYGFPTAKAMSHVRQRVREELGSDVRRPLREVIKYLNPILRGWSEYYRWFNSAHHFRKIDKYVVFKLQRWLRRQTAADQTSLAQAAGRVVVGARTLSLLGTECPRLVRTLHAARILHSRGRPTLHLYRFPSFAMEGAAHH